MTDDSQEKQPPAPPAGEKTGAPEVPSKPTVSGAPPEAGPVAPAKPPAPAGVPPAAGAPPKPPAPPAAKAPPIAPVPLENDLVKRYKARFGGAVREAWEDRKQQILVVDRAQFLEIARYTRDAEQFDLLSDLTAVDWPKREKHFDVVLNLYSFAHNARLRIKTHVGEGESVASVAGVWSTANWLEREVYDMFGIRFEGHPNLKRILMPDEWQGHPLRKDYDILTQDTAWVRENLGIESGQ